MDIMFLGPAGSGKTSLVHSFSQWIICNQDRSVSCINLDPGAEYLPYKADFDIRKFFTIESIMKEEKLGPNGAFLRAMEKMVEMKDKIKPEIERIKADFRLIDLPGQLEPFLFYSGEEIISYFDKKRMLGLFLIPAEMFNPKGIAIAELLSLIVRLKLEIPTINVLTKVDLARNAEEIESFLKYPEKLRRVLEKIEGGMEKDLAIIASRLVEKIAREQRIVKTSAKTGEGMKDLYDICYEIFCTCGDLR
ncbi:MAG: ATP/GTP-binding protein [Candidatus Aenigmarchaeota archaeon]|nr:ATP/GTP-binding protein [Candidatus Aenigmarchaeota archaeon]